MDTQPAATLELAHTKLAAGETRAAFDALLAAWRACRAGELAELVDQLSHRATPPFTAAGKTRRERFASLLAHIRAAEPIELAGSWEHVREIAEVVSFAELALVLDELVGVADDPRITRPVLAMLELPGGGSGWGKIHTRLLTMIERSADPRAAVGLAALVDRLGQNGNEVPATQRELVRRGRKLLDRLPEAPAPTPPSELAPLLANLAAAIARVEPIQRITATDTLDELWQAILAAPDDDAPRLVYADALGVRGDPRGELIALQLQGRDDAARARADALIAKHGRRWLGTVAPFVPAHRVVFARGFIAACELAFDRQSRARALADHRELQLVERVHFAGKFMHAGASWVALAEVSEVDEFSYASLAAVARPRLVRVHVGGLWVGRAAALAATLGRRELFPALREVAVRRFWGSEDGTPPWLAMLEPLAHVDALVLEGDSGCRLTVAPRERALTIAFAGRADQDWATAAFEREAVRSLAMPAGVLRAISIVSPFAWSADALRAISATRGRLDTTAIELVSP